MLLCKYDQLRITLPKKWIYKFDEKFVSDIFWTGNKHEDPLRMQMWAVNFSSHVHVQMRRKYDFQNEAIG